MFLAKCIHPSTNRNCSCSPGIPPAGVCPLHQLACACTWSPEQWFQWQGTMATNGTGQATHSTTGCCHCKQRCMVLPLLYWPVCCTHRQVGWLWVLTGALSLTRVCTSVNIWICGMTVRYDWLVWHFLTTLTKHPDTSLGSSLQILKIDINAKCACVLICLLTVGCQSVKHQCRLASFLAANRYRLPNVWFIDTGKMHAWVSLLQWGVAAGFLWMALVFTVHIGLKISTRHLSVLHMHYGVWLPCKVTCTFGCSKSF